MRSRRQCQSSFEIVCRACNSRYDSVQSGICPSCGERVEVTYALPTRCWISSEPGMWRYRAMLPVSRDLGLVTLGEGGTPLVRSCAIGPRLGFNNLYFKLESCNPSGSFKDRIASLMVSRFAAEGTKTILTVTSGNAGSAVAAYGARAGIRTVVLRMSEAPASKGLQMHAHGALVIALSGVSDSPKNLEQAFTKMFDIGREQGWPVSVMSHFYDPIDVEAYKTISFEICEATNGAPPDYVYIPVGGGGLFAGAWKGFREFHQMGEITRLPRMIAVQPKGAAPVMKGWTEGKKDAMRVNPQSVVSGIGGAYASDGTLVMAAISDSGGHCSCPTDEETFKVQGMLAREEGIFAEPAGAISVAAFIRDVSDGRLQPDTSVVCLITGSGFKDREAAEKLFMPDEVPAIDITELNRIPVIVRESKQGSSKGD